MLIVMRVLGGGAAASVQAVGAGTIADIWDVRERGTAMGIFYLGPLMGPLLAPIIGGVLAENLGWRSTQWFLAIYGGILLVFILFALPETLKAKKGITQSENKQVSRGGGRSPLSRVSSRQIVQQKTKKWVAVTKRILIDPLRIILYLRFPAVLITVYYASITFGSLYVLNISLQYTFAKPPYNFSTVIVGLTYIPNSIGYVLASIFGGRWMDSIMHREARKAGRYDAKGKLMYRPEDRMRENAWIAAVLYPGAMIWYGWTAQKGVFWVVPVSPLSGKPITHDRQNGLTWSPVAHRQFLLRGRQHDHLQHVDHHADGVHAEKGFFRSGSQQFRSKYLLVRWRYRRATAPK